MTENKHEKRAIRRRMAETGEKYTVASRALREPGLELPDLVRPGSMVAIINSGGATNLSLAMPVLARHLEDGGHLVLTQYGDDRFAIPGAPDLVVGRGIATTAEIAGWIEDRDEGGLRQAFEAAVSGVQVFKGPTTPERLVAALALGPNPLLFVQDIQTDPPILLSEAEDRLSDYELVPDNARAIRKAIAEAGSTAIVCHCMGAEDIESWEPLAAVCDYTLAIEHDHIRLDRDEGQIAATIEVFDASGHLGSYETTIDSEFLDWRHPLIKSS